MKYVFLTLLLLTHQGRAADEGEAKTGSVAQAVECEDFSQVGFKDRTTFLNYLSDLKAARTAEDFAKLVTYPLRVNRKPQRPLVIENEASFKQNFKNIFPEKVLAAIRGAEQKDNFCNYQGMTIANGTVWIDKKKDRTGIFVINH